MSTRAFFSTLLALCVGLFLGGMSVVSVHAQTPNTNLNVHIATPRVIEPNTFIDVTLQAYTIKNAVFYWFLNGEEVTSYRGLRSVQIPTGNVGEETLIQVATFPHLSAAFVEKRIRPAAVDMIIEANSTVPVFYAGRALPHDGSEVRLTAIVHNGTFNDSRHFSYRWKLNGKVYQGGPLVGKQSIDLLLDKLHYNEVELTVYDTYGTLIAFRRYTIPTVDPELYFYIQNPLKGLSRKAIQDRYTFLDDEVHVRAEPYFANPTAFDSEINRWGWSINKARVEEVFEDPQDITLRKAGDSGRAIVSFYVRDVLEHDYTAANDFTVYCE